MLEVALVIVVLVVAVLIFAATKPNTFRVYRSASINARPEKIFPFINDFRNWGAWSPYESKDPTMKRTYSGATNGKGAVYGWQGNKNVGEGRMEIAEVSPPFSVRLKLDFVRPFEAHNTVDFTLKDTGRATIVTWSMQGPLPYLAKVMHVLINMDRMVGKDFETGLTNLKAVAEK
jgi:hypothetical protein